MTATLAVFAGAFGTLIGSFLNVVIYRLPRGERFGGASRSQCPQCKALIHWYDNLPLLSYLVLRGRCRACGWRIPVRYPLVEALTGALFAACMLRAVAAGWQPVLLAGLLTGGFAAMLVAASFIDLAHQLLPDALTLRTGLPLAAITVLLVPRLHGTALLGSDLAAGGMKASVASLVVGAAGAAVGGGLLMLIRVIGGRLARREAMGLGDVKLMAACGLLLGPEGTIQALFSALLIGAVVGGGTWLLARRKEMPFGPFLAVGTLLILLWQEPVTRIFRLVFGR